MRVILGTLTFLLVLDMIIIHGQMANLQRDLLTNEPINNLKMRKAFEQQDRLIKAQEINILRQTVSLQDRFAFVEMASNECKFQNEYFSRRLDKIDPPAKVPNPVELPNRKVPK